MSVSFARRNYHSQVANEFFQTHKSTSVQSYSLQEELHPLTKSKSVNGFKTIIGKCAHVMELLFKNALSRYV